MAIPKLRDADTFVAKLVREEVLTADPVVDAVLAGRMHVETVTARTLRHCFAHATGLSPKHIQQVEHAQRAAALLRHGVSILDTAHELGYYDQPHLTRSLKRWVGHTPREIAGLR